VLRTNFEASATPNVTVINKKTAQTYGQKRRKASTTTDSSANPAAMSSNDSFDQKPDNLKTLGMLWKQGKRTRIVMINEDEAEPSCEPPKIIRKLSNQQKYPPQHRT
jgi:hypothetical protein